MFIYMYYCCFVYALVLEVCVYVIQMEKKQNGWWCRFTLLKVRHPSFYNNKIHDEKKKHKKLEKLRFVYIQC